jgi:putative flippase GtrA
MDIRRAIKQGFRYGITGGAGLVINLGFLFVLVEYAEMSELIAAVLSSGITLSLTFIATEHWVFALYESDGRQTTLKRAPLYYLVMVAGKGVNYGIYIILLSLEVWYPVAWLIGSVTVFGGTFLMNRFVWHRTTSYSVE